MEWRKANAGKSARVSYGIGKEAWWGKVGSGVCVCVCGEKTGGTERSYSRSPVAIATRRVGDAAARAGLAPLAQHVQEGELCTPQQGGLIRREGEGGGATVEHNAGMTCRALVVSCASAPSVIQRARPDLGRTAELNPRVRSPSAPRPAERAAPAGLCSVAYSALYRCQGCRSPHGQQPLRAAVGSEALGLWGELPSAVSVAVWVGQEQRSGHAVRGAVSQSMHSVR